MDPKFWTNTNTNNIRTQNFGRIRIRIFAIRIIFEYYSNTELFAHLWYNIIIQVMFPIVEYLYQPITDSLKRVFFTINIAIVMFNTNVIHLSKTLPAWNISQVMQTNSTSHESLQAFKTQSLWLFEKTPKCLILFFSAFSSSKPSWLPLYLYLYLYLYLKFREKQLGGKEDWSCSLSVWLVEIGFGLESQEWGS